MKSRLGLRGRLGLAFAVVASVLVFGATAAYAEGYWTYMTGTCYANGNWYTSSQVRAVHSGNNVIKVYMNYGAVPGGGLSIYAKNYDTNQQIGVVQSFKNNYDLGDKYLTTSVAVGTRFVNVFRETTPNVSPYSWNGNEYY